MSKCLIDGMCMGDDCKKCSSYDGNSSVEIRLYDHDTNKSEYKRLTKSELDELRIILRLKRI